MTHDQDQKMKEYLKKWNPFLLLQDNGDAHSDPERHEVNTRWKREIEKSLEELSLPGLANHLIRLACATNDLEDRHPHLQFRAIFTLLCFCPEHPYLDRVLGKEISDRLDIDNLPRDYLAPKGINLPWQNFSKELDQFVIETIRLCLQIYPEHENETAWEWYCRQLIVLAVCREDLTLIDHFRDLGIDAIQILEDLIRDLKIPKQVRESCNGQICVWLLAKNSNALFKGFTKMVYNRLTDRQHGIGYETDILEEQILTLIDAASESQGAEKEVRTYLNEQAIGIALLYFGQGNAFRETKVKLVKFYVAGGVRAPITDQYCDALTLMAQEVQHDIDLTIPLHAAISTYRRPTATA